MRRYFLTCVAVMSLGSVWAAERPKRPNVVLILADDLGWQDVGCYDLDAPSPMETPRLDAFAKKGVKFWQAYSPSPVCAPSRCAIMSGTDPARAQKTSVVGGAPPAPNNVRGWGLMAPWFSGRMPADEMTLARVLKENGYATGHAGKWHMAIDHHAFPQPEDQGFEWTRSSRGTTIQAQPHRLAGFSTTRADDPYRLDEHGFPFHQNSEDALTFLRENNERPFFLYYATWLVHTPIHTRSQPLLDKYVKKLGLTLTDDAQKGWTGEGQTNPFYCAMVEQLDYYVGKVFSYLEETDDPRWPGHKLSENTYVIFTSDNGGMEGHPGEIITDNYPLDRGKISAMEGGTRVPLMVVGPGIAAGVESDVMVNGLDFFPTVLTLTGVKKPADKLLDGADLSALLKEDPKNAALVKAEDGSPRDTMVWHFPHSVAMESTIRVGDFKLIRNYGHVQDAKIPELELYRLYKTEGGKQVRVDIEESKNLAERMPEKAREMSALLTKQLTERKASLPYLNPRYVRPLPHKEAVPTVTAHERQGMRVTCRYKENGSRVVRGQVIYTLNGNARYEEWFREPAALDGKGTVTATLPEGATHYYINLIDEHRFLVSYPEVVPTKEPSLGKLKKFAPRALATQ